MTCLEKGRVGYTDGEIEGEGTRMTFSSVLFSFLEIHYFTFLLICSTRASLQDKENQGAPIFASGVLQGVLPWDTCDCRFLFVFFPLPLEGLSS